MAIAAIGSWLSRDYPAVIPRLSRGYPVFRDFKDFKEFKENLQEVLPVRLPVGRTCKKRNIKKWELYFEFYFEEKQRIFYCKKRKSEKLSQLRCLFVIRTGVPIPEKKPVPEFKRNTIYFIIQKKATSCVTLYGSKLERTADKLYCYLFLSSLFPNFQISKILLIKHTECSIWFFLFSFI